MFDRIRKAFRRSPRSVLLYREGNAGAHAASSNESLYRNCVPVRRAVDLLADSVAQLDIDTDLEFDDLVGNVTPGEFLYMLVVEMLVHGFGVVRVERNTDSLLPESIHVLTQGVNVEFDDPRRVRVKEGNRYLRPSEFIFIPEGTHSYGYESRVRSVQRVADTWLMAMAYIENEFVNGRKTWLAIGSDTSILPDEETRIIRAIKEGSESSKRPMLFMDRGKRIAPVSIGEPADADIRHLLDEMVRAIAGHFGVPAVSLGSPSEKYANTTAATVSFFRESVSPLARRIGTHLARGLDSPLEINVEQLIRGDVAAAVDLSTKAVTGGVLSLDEARRMFFGLPPDPTLAATLNTYIDHRTTHGNFPRDDGVMNGQSNFQHFDN